jgi:DNA primase
MPIISQETIQKILDETDIVELIEGYFPLKRAGVNRVAVCPFHNEKTPSFNVNPTRQIFHCFGCGAGGDAIKFIMMYENLSFPEAAKRLADRAGIMIQEEAYDAQYEAKMKGRREVMRLQKAAADWFHRILFKHPIAQPGRDYLKSRGLGMDTSRSWKFGYAPGDQRMFFDWARDEGFSMQQLVEGGLAKWRDENNPNRGAYSFFRDRLMFPVNNEMGEPIAFSGRHVLPDQSGGKYVNTPETTLFNKGKVFFGFDKTKRPIVREGKVIIFEGQLDLIAAYENGIQNAVAPLGTAFTPDHARVLKRNADEAILCFDSDTAGLNAAKKAFRILAPSGMLVRLALLPQGEDPDSLIQKNGPDSLRQILEHPPEFFDFQIDRRGSQLSSGTLRDRLNFAKDLAEDISLVEDKMLQDSLISRVTVRLGVGEEEIRKQVRDAVANQERLERSRQRRESTKHQRGPNPDQRQNLAPGSALATPAAPTVINNRTIRLLCKALLSDTQTRNSIAASPIPIFFDNIAETELLTTIWRADMDPDNHASVNAFIATLPPQDQQCLNGIMNEDSATINTGLAQDCLRALNRQSIQNQIARTKAQMGSHNMPSSELERLGKQLLDLRGQLNDC